MIPLLDSKTKGSKSATRQSAHFRPPRPDTHIAISQILAANTRVFLSLESRLEMHAANKKETINLGDKIS